MISGTIVLGADSDLPDTIAIGNHHVPKLYGLPLLMPLWNKDYVVLECGVIAALEHRIYGVVVCIICQPHYITVRLSSVRGYYINPSVCVCVVCVCVWCVSGV